MAPTDRPSVVVADAGPLIHLDELDCLDLLEGFLSVIVPDAVRGEVEHHRPGALQKLIRPDYRIAPPPSPELSALFRAFALDIGEQEALSCLDSCPDAILLTDDAAARLAAKTLRLRTHGTVGILLRAIRRNQRSRDEVLGLLHEIPHRSTLHIRPSLLREIIAEVEITSPPAPAT